MRDIGPYAALVLRVTLGLMFIAHLYWKFEILPGGFDRWASGLVAAGYPAFVPWYVISAELAGALLLIPGIYTRWVSLYALPMMLGAAEFWLVRKGFYFTAAGKGEMGSGLVFKHRKGNGTGLGLIDFWTAI